MFCPNCGASTSGKFCEKCGTPVNTGAASGSNAPPVMTAAGLPMNIAAALCYIFPIICSIIFLVVDPYKRDRNVRFAAFQGLFLALAFVVLTWILEIILSTSAYNLLRLVNLIEFILFVYLAFRAFQNEKVVLPGIGPIAQKQA